MENQLKKNNIEKEKVAAIGTLFFASVMIIIMGLAISLFSLANNINFPVMHTRVHGALFGVPVIYLGFRYFIAFRDLRTKAEKSIY